MFEPSERPRVFHLPLGVDFPKALVDGLMDRHKHRPPEDLARVELIVNTRRMARRIRALFDAGPALLLPRITLVTDLGDHWDLARIPEAVPPLRRRLELVQLLSGLLDQAPDLAPRSSLYDLADSLADLMDEMHGEGVSPDRIERLDVTDKSGHWARTIAFLRIVRHYFDENCGQPGTEARQRMVIEHTVKRWQVKPPDHPIIVAGSTGSRGATQLLMQAVARLPLGAVVLPGFDTDMPAHVWDKLHGGMPAEDHPQYRFFSFAQNLGMSMQDISAWSQVKPVHPARNEVLSLALRPAPVTDQWLRDGPALRNVRAAMENVTLLEAASPRQEALAIAMRLRHAAETGKTAALITPDRTLSRQVVAALDRWKITPDDSAGLPLQLSPPGRFLRHVGDLFRQKLSAELLLTLLKHPLTHRGDRRNAHLLLSRELELHLRRHGPPFPNADDLRTWASGRKEEMAAPWIEWICACFIDREAPDDAPLESRVADHLKLAEMIAQGSVGSGAGTLWNDDAGREAKEVTDELLREAHYGGNVNAIDYTSLFNAILRQKEIRNPVEPHPQVLIWGTLEARVQGADLLILAGLNEGGWPEVPAPDPWLNRSLRLEANLLLPERRIGLSAHDFQQAAAADEVWLTRSTRSDDAETVTSRWLNRLQNLLEGLPEQGGKEALDAMKDRGRHWLAMARQLEKPDVVEPAPRPAPCPPPSARPARLSVTDIKHLIRDPYAIYGKRILRLAPLDPLMKVPDALMRGTVLHTVLEGFIRDTCDDMGLCNKAHLLHVTESVLAQYVPWAQARATWLARMDRIADTFISAEMARRETARPIGFECRGAISISELDFTLSATADRIDLAHDGLLNIYDYKTGKPPTPAQQTHFDKQLLLEAVIAENAGFDDIEPVGVGQAVYIGLGSDPKDVTAPLKTETTAKVWSEFRTLMGTYFDADTGYTARRAMETKRVHSMYDQLARFGEWDITDPPHKDRF